MLTKGKKRTIGIVSGLVTLTAIFTVWASAADTGWTNPTSPLTVDKSYVTVAAHRAAQVAPEILGINNVATEQLGGLISGKPLDERATLADAKQNAMLGMFGSNANENPDPYIWNYFYNCYAAENGAPLTEDFIYNFAGAGTTVSPAMADTKTVKFTDGEETSVSLHRRPDILLGTDKNTTYNNTYTDLIATLAENTDGDTSNNYNPALVPYSMTTTYDMAQSILNMATAAQQIVSDSNGARKTRYGNPVVLAKDYEKYIKGISLYILSELEKQGIAKKSVAVINPSNTAIGGGYFQAYTSTTVSGTSTSRSAEYVDYTTNNLLNVLGKSAQTIDIHSGSTVTPTAGCYQLSYQELLQADVIILTGATSSTTTTSAFKTLLEDTYNVKESDIPEILSTLPSCVYGITMNSAENAIGFGYFNGFVYPQIISPIYSVAYFYENLFHITNQTTLATAIDQNMKNASLPSGVTTSLSNYSSADFEKMIAQGLRYYEANKTKFQDTKLKPIDTAKGYDWSAGIGSNVKASSVTVKNTSKSGGSSSTAPKALNASIDSASQSKLEKAIVDKLDDTAKALYNKGEELKVNVEVTAMKESDINTTELSKIKNSVKKTQSLALFFDININYSIGGTSGSLTELSDTITITIDLPAEYQGKTGYVIYRVHNGEITAITPTLSKDGKQLTFQTNRFSTYAIAYTATAKAAATSDATPIYLSASALVFSAIGVTAVEVSRRKRYGF